MCAPASKCALGSHPGGAHNSLGAKPQLSHHSLCATERAAYAFGGYLSGDGYLNETWQLDLEQLKW